jgi:YVTN family beta-propeller protein
VTINITKIWGKYLLLVVIGIIVSISMIVLPNSIGAQTLENIMNQRNEGNPQIKVGHSPTSLAVNPNTNKVYVANFRSNTVSVIDASSGSIINNIPTEDNPVLLSVNPNTNKVYVTYGLSKNVTVIDGNTDRNLTNIRVGNYNIEDLTVDPDENTIYILTNIVHLSRSPLGMFIL